uniref:Uncharacterized protein n=1 Tax=Chromera velia CCMP2878 TaxID=1169474 RepID=A0A0G4HLD1_9ALVE|eukprot:Cvel_7332.t1-p1 / transcript=Cvel_7332.t1 / gene=Cvel_7332 / organism=Chromera_velia_CCMP2878 / gene_product=hypothetical protein / transcript_product=hypothetical protein / location=Cvel_scaffold380:36631-37578(-) / protein_length=316 / sequence_SO=supercontig / SO=protein_coding / is_pseudo=false
MRSTVWKYLCAVRDGTPPSEKKERTHEYLGCSFPDLKPHLEKDDFHGNPGMSWENYGSLWHVDHIVPIMYVGPDGQKPDTETLVSRLHFSNLQPMWSGENLRKGNRFVGKPPPISHLADTVRQRGLMNPPPVQDSHVSTAYATHYPKLSLRAGSPACLKNWSLVHTVGLKSGESVTVHQSGVIRRGGISGVGALTPFPTHVRHLSVCLPSPLSVDIDLSPDTPANVLRCDGKCGSLSFSRNCDAVSDEREGSIPKAGEGTLEKEQALFSTGTPLAAPSQKGLCPHGRQQYDCKECGGKGICEHGRRRRQCKECGGS